MRARSFGALRDGWRDFEAGHFEAAAHTWSLGARHAGADEKLVLEGMRRWSEGLQHVGHGAVDQARTLLEQSLASLAQVSEDFRGCDLDALKDGLTSALAGLREGKAAAPRWDELKPLGTVRTEHQGACPSCGSPVQVTVPYEELTASEAVEDCPVCCRPMLVRVQRLDGEPQVSLSRS